jgi:hypothetical protein
MRDADPEAAIGQVREFWRRVRQRWLGTRYFCWLELQRRGAVHYHCIWLNPPHVKRVNLVKWIDWAWGQGRTQVRFSGDPRGLEREMEYAIGHAKKMGKKRYQQRYDDASSALRTFMSQRLEIAVEVLDEHMDQDIWVYRPPSEREYRLRPGIFEKVDAYVEWIGERKHEVPPAGRCTALDHRRPGRSAAARASPAIGGARSASISKASRTSSARSSAR